MKKYNVAVVGATGAVGIEMVKMLEHRDFPVGNLYLFASSRTAGRKMKFRGMEITVEDITALRDFSVLKSKYALDVALFSAGGSVSLELSPKFAAQGIYVIDNSSAFRMDKNCPLVVPEVNPEDIAKHERRGIIANPNCSTIQMVVALNPLHKRAGLKRVVVSTYQAVSGKGKHAMDELGAQVTALFSHREPDIKVFPRRIAFNCIPHIDVFLDDGFTKEEHKMLFETRKIMHLPEVGVCATCVRVPVFNGHAEVVVAEFERPITPVEARETLRGAPGVMLMDEPKDTVYPTQLDVDGSDATFIGRIRQDPSQKNSLVFWCVADNLRKGAASNAVQIAELLVRDYL